MLYLIQCLKIILSPRNVLVRYLDIDYVVLEKKDDVQHERKTLRYLAIIKSLVGYITYLHIYNIK